MVYTCAEVYSWQSVSDKSYNSLSWVTLVYQRPSLLMNFYSQPQWCLCLSQRWWDWYSSEERRVTLYRPWYNTWIGRAWNSDNKGSYFIMFYRTRCRVPPCVSDTSTSFLDFSIEVKKRGEERTGRNVFDYPTATGERRGQKMAFSVNHITNKNKSELPTNQQKIDISCINWGH